MRRIRNAFVTGLLVLVPLMATADILRWFVRNVDQSARNYFPSFVLPFDFSGLGLLVALILVLTVGILTQNYVGKTLVSLFDSGMRRTPLIGGLYGAIKKFLETIFSPSSDQFHGTALVEFPRQGVYSIGFRTGKPDKRLTDAANRALVNIFVPCTPNPTSGFYLLVPEDQLIALDLSVQDAFKIVVSMGLVTNEDIVHQLGAGIKR